jgi:competence protein ComEC
VHVLAISGQHLVLVAWACFLLGRVLGFRTRQVVLVVAILVLIYALVTGGRPPALRAAITVLSAAVAWLSRRPPSFVNCLALSWLVVAILMPADLGSTGCLLSFFATGLLHWATRAWWREQTEEEEAYKRAVELSRPGWISWLIGRGREIGEAYRVNLIVWLGLTPLVAARTYMVSLVAVVVGPPVAFLGGWALGFGFLLLLAGPNLPVISALLSLGTTWALRGCRWLAWWGESLPGAWFSTPGLGIFWLVIFHLVLTGGLVGLWPNIRWRLVIGLAISFVLFPLLPMKQWLNPVQPGWRCAFLAVGHGSCVVLELTDANCGRRVVVMDVGAVSGDGVTRRIVEPYLRHRGISMVDDLVISHADLDHYAGALELADRVKVKKVWVGPGFAEKRNESTAILLEGLKQRQLSPALLHAGLALRWGETEIRVIHPPADYQPPPGAGSNESSLVLLVQGPQGSALLPGDLEKTGTDQVLQAGLPPVDVLLAPHHGSPAALTRPLLAATKPKLLVAQQGQRDAKLPAGGFLAWSTREKGAVEVEANGQAMIAKAFATGEVELLLK